jgi:hypothetical protein
VLKHDGCVAREWAPARTAVMKLWDRNEFACCFAFVV